MAKVPKKELELAWRYGREFVDLKNHCIEQNLLRTIPVDLILGYNFIPLEEDGDRLAIAVSDPSQFMTIDEICLHTGKRIIVKVASASQISEILRKTDFSLGANIQ